MAGNGIEHRTAVLLWEACRVEPDATAVRGIVDEGIDPELLVGASVRHGMESMLWRAISAAGVEDRLGELAPQLADLSEIRRHEGRLIVPRAVRRAITPLTEAGLEPVILKGPWLASRYPEPGLRTMTDIDVLLPPEYHPAALEALTDHGWATVRGRTVDHYDTVLVHRDVPGLPLELHYAFEARHLRTTEVDARGFWQRKVPVDCLGTPAFALAPEEEFVALAQHAGKPFHSFMRLIWIADLAVVEAHVRLSGGHMDWERVRALAVDGHCTTVVGVAAALARRLGAPVPTDLFPLPRAGWRSDALVPLFDDLWPLRADDAHAFHLRFALTDDIGKRVRMLVGSKYVMSEVPLRRWALDVPAESTRRVLRWRRSRRELRKERARVQSAG